MEKPTLQKLIILHASVFVIYLLVDFIFLSDPFYSAIEKQLNEKSGIFNPEVVGIRAALLAAFFGVFLLTNLIGLILCYRLKKLGRTLFTLSTISILFFSPFLGVSLVGRYGYVMEFLEASSAALIIYGQYFTSLSNELT